MTPLRAVAYRAKKAYTAFLAEALFDDAAGPASGGCFPPVGDRTILRQAPCFSYRMALWKGPHVRFDPPDFELLLEQNRFGP